MLPIVCHSHNLDEISSFTPETSKIVNNTTIQTTQLIKKSQKSEEFTIAKDWKLITAIKSSDKPNVVNSEYVLFFQDSKSNIHTIGIYPNGMISGNNIIHIKANE